MAHVLEDLGASGWRPGPGFTAPPAEPRPNHGLTPCARRVDAGSTWWCSAPVRVAGGAIVAIGGLAGDPERVTQMWVGAELTTEGSTPVVEVIDYDFGLARRQARHLPRHPGPQRRRARAGPVRQRP